MLVSDTEGPGAQAWLYIEIRDAPFDIWGGGGARKKMKKKVCLHKSQKKKVCWKCGQKKKIVVGIDEKYVDQKKTPTGNVHNRESIQQKISSTKHKKKIVGRWSPKKRSFSLGDKKKFASNKNSSPPPPRYLMVRPLEWCNTT